LKSIIHKVMGGLGKFSHWLLSYGPFGLFAIAFLDSVLVASVLPPPFPFKLFVVSAGVFRLPVWRFTMAIAAGRTFRYLLEGYLAARYGEHAKEILAHYYPAIGIGLAVLLIVIFVSKNLMRRARVEPVSGVES